jgi:hypothetical protein
MYLFICLIQGYRQDYFEVKIIIIAVRRYSGCRPAGAY